MYKISRHAMLFLVHIGRNILQRNVIHTTLCTKYFATQYCSCDVLNEIFHVPIFQCLRLKVAHRSV